MKKLQHCTGEFVRDGYVLFRGGRQGGWKELSGREEGMYGISVVEEIFRRSRK